MDRQIGLFLSRGLVVLAFGALLAGACWAEVAGDARQVASVKSAGVAAGTLGTPPLLLAKTPDLLDAMGWYQVALDSGQQKMSNATKSTIVVAQAVNSFEPSPSDVETGQDLCREKKYPEAIAALEPLLQCKLDKSTLKPVLVTLNECYRATQQWGKKAQVVQSLLQSNPEEEGGWLYDMANDLSLQHKYAEAIPDDRESLPRLPLVGDRFWGLWWIAKACAHADRGRALDDSLAEVMEKQEEPDWYAKTVDGVLRVLIDEKVDVARGNDLLTQMTKRVMDRSLDKAERALGLGAVTSWYTTTGQWDTEAKLLDSASASCPEDEGMWQCQRANDLRVREKYAEAIPFYKDAVAKLAGYESLYPRLNYLDPLYIARDWLAQCYARVSPRDGLEDCMNDLRRDAPDWAPQVTLDVTGILRNDDADPEMAVKLLEQSIAEAPNHPLVGKSRMILAKTTLFALGRPADARKVLAELQDWSGVSTTIDGTTKLVGDFDVATKAKASYYLASCSYVGQNWAEAVLALRSVCEDYPNEPICARAKYFIGDCHVRMNDISAAENEFSEVAKAYPDSFWAGEAKMRLSQLREQYGGGKVGPVDDTARISTADKSDVKPVVDAKPDGAMPAGTLKASAADIRIAQEVR